MVPGVMATTKTYIIQVHNEYDWNDNYDIEDVKQAITGFNCSPECEGVTFQIDWIKEFKPDA